MLGQNDGRRKRPNLLQAMHGKTLHREMDSCLGNSQIPISGFFYNL